MELHGTFPWNSMENVDAEISMEIGVLMFSMEVFHTGYSSNLSVYISTQPDLNQSLISN